MKLIFTLLFLSTALLIFGCAGATNSSSSYMSTSDARGISKEAEKTKNQTLCEKITVPYWKDDCYAGVAMAINDVSLCSKMEDAVTRELCYSGTAKDLATCNTIQNQDVKDMCYARVAKVKNDSTICDGLQNQDWKMRCKTDTK